MVSMLDADKEGFLRSETSLIQTIGRAARNVNAKVILYADKVTDSMQKAIDETDRRREIQRRYNEQHGITPETIHKNIRAGIETESSAHRQANAAVGRTDEQEYITQEYLQELEAEMLAAADSLEFERAGAIRDRIMDIRESQGDSAGAKTKASSATERPAKGRRGKGRNGGRVPRPKKR